MNFPVLWLSFVNVWVGIAGSHQLNSYQAPVVQKVDNAIHRINHYPLDIAIGFAITYPVDSDLSGG